MKNCTNPFCNSLKEELKSLLCRNKVRLNLNIKTEYIFDFNDNNLLLVNKGKILTIRNRISGQRKGIELLTDGALLGITSLFTQKDYTISMIPIEKTECCSFSKSTLISLCKQNGELTLLLLKELTKRFNLIIQDSEHISLDNSQEKIDYVLNKDIKNLTLEEVALLAGLHRVTVSNILSKKLRTKKQQ